jgi:hypothetical protein
MAAHTTSDVAEPARRAPRLPRRVRLSFGAGQGGSAIIERLVFMWRATAVMDPSVAPPTNTDRRRSSARCGPDNRS